MGSPAPLLLVDSFPRDGDGLECESGGDASCGIPREAPLEYRFDRYLLPSSAVRQSVSLTSGPGLFVFLAPDYDMLERVLTFRPVAGPLDPGLLYRAELFEPTSEQSGLRAFDGAPLEAAERGLIVEYRAAAALSDDEPRPPDPPVACWEVLELMDGAGCSLSGCHGSEAEPAMGLLLDGEDGLRQTAIGRVARQTQTGPHAERPLENTPRFGQQMPIIDPGTPSNSYLMYKLVLNEQNFGEDPSARCSDRYTVGAPRGACGPPGAAERRRLREYFVLGEAMPPPDTGLALGGRDALRAIQTWIAQGATTHDCDPVLDAGPGGSEATPP